MTLVYYYGYFKKKLEHTYSHGPHPLSQQRAAGLSENKIEYYIKNMYEYMSERIFMIFCIFVSVPLLLNYCFCTVVLVPLFLYRCFCTFVSVPLFEYCCFCTVVSVLLFLYRCFCTVVSVSLFPYCCFCAVVSVLLFLNC